MTAIEDIQAREILDSRGNPTVEVDVLFPSRYKESDPFFFSTQFQSSSLFSIHNIFSVS